MEQKSAKENNIYNNKKELAHQTPFYLAII